MIAKKIALILSGCGHLDGAEITEAVSLNICLQQQGYSVVFFAPDRGTLDTVNHLNGQQQNENRNIMVEAARIARGQISPLDTLNVTEYQAIALPGGFGAVKNFSNFLSRGGSATLSEDIAQILVEAIRQKIALLGICAAPLILAMAVKEAGHRGQQITFGTRSQSKDFLDAIEPWGVEHIETDISQCHIDRQYRLVTSAAYMYATANAAEIFSGVQTTVAGLDALLS